MKALRRIFDFARGLKSPSEYLADRLFPERETTSLRVCAVCAHVAIPARQMVGRADVERYLWGIVLGLGVLYLIGFILLQFTALRPIRWGFKLTSMSGKVFLILSMAYSVIRLSIRTKVCPLCGAHEVIPSDSPRGKEILRRHSNQ